MKPYPEYMDSKVNWLGRIPKNWGTCKLKRLVDMRSGESLPTGEIDEAGDFAVYGGNGLRGYTKAFTHDGPYVLIGRQGALCGNINYADGQFWATEHAVVVTPKQPMNVHFIGELLRVMNLNQYSESAAQPGLSVSKISNLMVPDVPFEEQERIGSYVKFQSGLIDQMIEKNTKLLELLDDQRKAIINEAVTKGLDPKAPMKDSGVEWLGEVPKHWTLQGLRHLTTKLGSGVTPRGGAAIYTEEGVVFIRSQNVHFDGLRLDGVQHIPHEIHEEMRGTKVERNDVLLNITGASIGRCCIVEVDQEMNVNQHVCIIRSTGSVAPKFLNLVMQSDIGQTQVRLGITGGNREGLNLEQLKGFVIPLPPAQEQQTIIEGVENKLTTLQQIDQRTRELIEALKQLREGTISEAVTGKIDLREWVPAPQQTVEP